MVTVVGKFGERMILIMSLVSVLAIGFADYHTGYKLAFAAFYLVPIIAATWLTGKMFGIILSVMSTIAWVAADIGARDVAPETYILVWNAVVRLSVFLLVCLLLARLKQALDVERLLSRTDNLTGLVNSRSFIEEINREIAFCRRESSPFALAYIDLDNFKKVNDSYGHNMGDILLRHIAHSLKLNIRSTDIAARLGGDEFAVFLPRTANEDAEVITDRLRKIVNREMEFNDWPVTLSVGLVSFNTPPATAYEAIKVADRIMYGVKRIGKNSMLHERIVKGSNPVDLAERRKGDKAA